MNQIGARRRAENKSCASGGSATTVFLWTIAFFTLPSPFSCTALRERERRAVGVAAADVRDDRHTHAERDARDQVEAVDRRSEVLEHAEDGAAGEVVAREDR